MSVAKKRAAKARLPSADEEVAAEVALTYLALALTDLTRRNWKAGSTNASMAARYLAEAAEYERKNR